ncbi:MAG: hypothetical protein WCV83_01020 [Candidatus Magasanikbacteria bacterium]
MFSIFKQRTIAVYHFLKLRKLHLSAFVFILILFLAGYLSSGIYSSSTGNLNIFSPDMAAAQVTTTAAGGGAPAAVVPTPATPVAGANQPEEVGLIMGFVIQALLGIASLVLRLAIFCLAFIIQVAGYNGYLSSTAVDVGWVMVRDITNMFFVVILLLIAFGTILGLEQYEWKKMLVKFFFAAVLVNFSRIICGVIIDVGQVVMITFVNGIAATIGGNMINAFSMDQIMGLANSKNGAGIQTSDLFIASVGAVGFSVMLLAMMVVFVYMLLARMIVLWILIILSPFAFVLSVIPQTQKYASQWWSEFGNHVIVGPAVVFFMWLSFAVVGGGNISGEIIANSAVAPQVAGEDAAGVGGIMGWTKMSNFIIAIGILLVGAKTAQSLGTVGGSAMSKATDIGKKAMMVASGASAAMWAGGKVKQGATAAAKWGAMNAPIVGGNRWIARGKKIAGRAGRIFNKFQMGRDEIVKNLGNDEKKLRDLKFKKDTGQISSEEYEEGIKKYHEEGGSGLLMRLVKKAGGMVVETQGRDMKRGDDWMDAWKAIQERRETEYSVSSDAGGQAKTVEKTLAKKSKEKSEGKGARKESEVLTGLSNQEMAKLESANKEYQDANDKLLADKVFVALDVKVKNKTATDEEKNAHQIASQDRTRAQKKFDDLSKKSNLSSSLTADIQKETAEGGRVKAETYLREMLLEGGSGKAGEGYYKGKATKKTMEAGHHAEEERQVMKAELKMAEAELTELRENGDGSIKDLEETVENLQTALEGLQEAIDPKKMISETQAKMDAARAKLAALDAEEASVAEKVRAPGVPPEEAAAATARLAEISKEKEVAQKEVTDTQTEHEEAKRLQSSMGKEADFGKMAAFMEKMAKINEMENGEEKNKAIAGITQDQGMMDMYRAVYGTKSIVDTLNNRKQLGALRKIQKALEKNKDKKGVKLDIVREDLKHDLSHEKDHESEHLNTAWHHASEKSPTIFAARSEALRDHDYAFYRGKKKELQNNAAQAEIWNKRGIPTPSGAAQEAVADELYGKLFKNMPYDQIKAAHNSHLSYVKAKRDKKEKVPEEDVLIGLAIANKLLDESWIDDSEVATMNQAYDPEKKGNFEAQLKNMRKARRGVSKLGPQNIDNLSSGLAKIKVDPNMLAKIRNNNQAEQDKFLKDYTRIIRESQADFENRSASEILQIILSTDREQFDDLSQKITSKSSK